MRVFESFRNTFKIKEVRDRIFITLGLLIVFRLGAHVPIPGIDPAKIEEFAKSTTDQLGYLAGVISVLTAGAFRNLALFSLGIMPYITASIIMSLMTKVSPNLEQIAKEGPSGQRKIATYTRWLTLPICIVQSFMTIGGVKDLMISHSFLTYATVVASLTAGAMFVMWLSEQITEFGIGNGASVLIMSGILARMPSIGLEFYERILKDPDFLHRVVIVVVLYVSTIVAIVFITQSQRRIPIQHAKQFRGRRVWMGSRNYLPLKINTAGVMPVIFASSLLTLPYLFAMIPGLDFIRDEFRPQRFVYGLFYVSCILFFSYFWTYLFFQPNEIANNLKEYGSFIPGIRPGENTAQYINFILARITICGAWFLALIALVPDLVSYLLGLDRYLVAFLGGTGILIVVGVCLDLIQKIESYLLLHHYGGFVGSSAIRGRR